MVVFVTVVVIDGGVCRLSHLLSLVVVFVTFVVIDGGVCHICCH